MKPILKHFNEINDFFEPVDFHIHTTFTDGSSTIQEYVDRALQLGIKEIAFTEHVRKDSQWYMSFVENVESIRESCKNDIRIYHGIETKVLNTDGDVDASDEMLETAELVLGSVHRFPDYLLKKENITPEGLAGIEFRLSEGIIKNPAVDILAHPGGMFIRKFNREFPCDYLKKLINLANKYNTAIEINSSYLKNIVFETDLFTQLNPYVSLGSDAHSMHELGTIVKFIKSIHQKDVIL